MESEIAGWLSVVFRFVHVLAAIMWIGNSLLFTWMELNLIAPQPDETGEKPDLLGHLDMLHGGGVFHLQKRIINPQAIPVPLHWFMWQSYTTWISGVLLLVSVFYIHGGAALVDATKTDLTGWRAIALSAGGIVGWWLIYNTLWNTKLKDHPKITVPLTLVLLIAAAFLFKQYFNGRAVFLQIGAMLGSSMSSNVFFHIIQNQKKFMKSLLAGLPHDMKYGKQAKTRSMHNHYMTFPVLFMMLSAHFPQLTSAAQNVPILAVILIALMAVKHLMNSRYYFKHWLASIFATFILACFLIGSLLAMPDPTTKASGVSDGAKLFVSQTCANCHLAGGSPIAPDLKGIFGSTQIMADDSKILADETYLRSSIKQPQLHVVKGFAPAMPALPLTDEQVDQLVAYLKSL
ncbi:MAG: urate hydroxylase PuuD [Luteolibacter sp.]|uniref:urate hydroxylase PuuD n=1 Tax=Luteolibacter sp. TaxID=1962973 RepID=UPI003263A3D3